MKRTDWHSTICSNCMRTIERAGALGLLALSLAFLFLPGCSSKNSASSTNSGGPTPGSSNPASTRVIAVVSPAKTSPFHVLLAQSAAQEAKRLGLPPIIDQAPPNESDYTGQVALVQDIIQRHPAAISVCGINPQALVNIVKKCNEAHIPIFVHNQISPVQGGGKVVSYIGYDEYEGGKKCGEEAAELLKHKNGAYKGNVAILDGEPGDHTNLRAGGFKDALKQYPDIHIVAEQNGHWLRADGTSITRDWLQRFPKLDLVFGCSDEMALGAAKAALDAGRPLLTIGIDGNPPSLEAIKEGKYTACLATQPDLIGKTVIDTINDYLNGKKVPQVVKTECVIVTKANVDKFLK